MKVIQRTGKSEFDIVTNVLKEFKITKDKLKYEVVDKGSNGFFNLFGGKPTVIKFFLPENTDSVKDFIENLLKMMNVEFNTLEVIKKNKQFIIKLNGVQNKGYLIGKNGRVLDSLQHITHRYLLQSGIDETRIMFDIDDFRKNNDKNINTKIEAVAEQVKKTKKTYTFDPMKPGQRRMIHKFVESDKELRTKTIGDGDKKKVQIIYDPDSAQTKPRHHNNNRKKFRNYRNNRNNNHSRNNRHESKKQESNTQDS